MSWLTFKFKKEWILWIAAGILLLFVVGYTMYSVSFLGRQLNAVIAEEIAGDGTIVQFDFVKLDELLLSKVGITTAR